MKGRDIVAVAILLGTLPVHEVQAVLTTNSWTVGSGKWETAGNWSAGAPTITQSANLVTNSTSKTVTIDASTPAGTLTISNLVVSGPSGTVNTLQLTNAPSSTLHILDSLLITNGGVLLVTNSTVLVGAPTYGTLSDDATVTLIDGTIIATNLMVVGNEGIGVMMVNTGKLVTGVFYLGYNPGSQGSLVVANGSQLITSNGFAPLYLGFSGTGQMLISNSTWLAGGESDLYLGFGPGTQGTLTMAGSTVTSLPFVDVGYSYGGTGSVWQTGGSMIATNSTFYIGDEGVGQMTISNGTWSASEVLVSYNPGSSGTLTLVGGTNQLASLSIAGQSEAGGETGAVWVTGGQLIMTNGVAVVGATGNGQMTVSNATWLVNEVDVAEYSGGIDAQGTLTLVGSTIVVSNIFAVGADDTTVTGAVWLTSSQLTVTGPTYVGWFGDGQLTVSNSVWLGTVLYVGYEPGSQGTLTIAGGTNIISSILDIGVYSSATGTVWLTGGQLIATNSYSRISDSGVGQMTISNGTFLNGDLDFGDGNTAVGTLTVAGGTATILGEFDVGSGTSTVWLTGGQLTVTNGTTTIGDFGAGYITVSNGMWWARNIVMGNIPISQGTLTIAGGVSSIYSNVTIGSTNCSAPGLVLITGGELHVTNDDATGVLEVRDGTLIQTGGLLDIDRLVITNPCAHFMHLGGTLIIGLETLSPDLDADGDGIPNGYELANGLDPLDPADASLDNDGDGMSNLQEYLAGTDPNNSASYFHITSMVRSGNDVHVTWMMGPGKTNALERTTGVGGSNYNTNNFAAIFTVTNTVGTVTNYLDVGGATNTPSRFYRVRLVP